VRCDVYVALVPDRGEPLGRLVDRLEPRERRLALTITPETRRRHFALGRQAARSAITRLLGARPNAGIPVAVLRGAFGEPVVQRPAGTAISVSVSHSGLMAVACAWRPRDVGLSLGVDLERVRPTGVGRSTWAFDARERREMEGDERELRALQGWAAKEAAWKASHLEPGRGPEALEILHLDPGHGVVLRVREESVHGGRSHASLVWLRTVEGPDALYLLALAAARPTGETA
jgi:4'-phosphopantetheinyl transferase EntD